MKKFTKTTLQFLKLALATILFGVLFASHANARTYNIDMELDAAQTAMKAVSRGNCDHDGCVQTEKGHHADIHFHLKKEFKDCNKEEDAKWELTAVYLGGKSSSTKPAAWGGLGSETEVLSDFEVADAATGLLTHHKGTNKRKIHITDKNDYAYDIWYTVQASCVSSAGVVLGTLELDPRVSNVGQ